MDPMRHKNVKGFTCTIFRHNYNQIFQAGGLWDSSVELYSSCKRATASIANGQWTFRNKKNEVTSKITFKHIERDQEVQNYQGGQICAIFWDELCHFSEYQFFYMLSRNRSTCGIKPYIRATCNPDADSWVAKFIEWWINQETGYPIQERSGVIRWMMRRNGVITWGDTQEELWEKFGLVTPEERAEPKSVTFIPSSIYDNKELLAKDPGYLANLKALPEIERERLLAGNWKIKASAGLFFKRTQLGNILEILPDDITYYCRCWDLAASEKDEKGDPAYTAGVLMGRRKNGRYVVIDVINRQMSAQDVRNTIKLTAQADRAKYKRVRIRIPQDPGQAGKEQAQSYIKMLAGFDITAVRESGSKQSRAEPMAAQWQAGNFDLMYGKWNEEYLYQLENFPDWKFKDMVDASANAFDEIAIKTAFNPAYLI